MERKLATIRRIAEIKPIENADTIEAVRVDGWWVVAKKGEYAVDQLACYLEIDSWVPTELAPFLSKGKEPKEFEGVKGERLRTIRLKGQVSQGLLLQIPDCISIKGCWSAIEEGSDCTEWLGILKYEKPLPAALAGLAKGNFPSFIPKTDQERIQNLGRQFEELKSNHTFEVTEKLDGSSMTVYCKTVFEDGFVKEQLSGVCSRNLDLKFEESNSFWEAAIKYDLIHKIFSTGRNLAIQGELVGEGIQGNSYKLIGRHFFCFDIWDIDKQEYLLPKERHSLVQQLGIRHVFVLEFNQRLLPKVSISDILKESEFKSKIGCNPEAEGKVYKSNEVHNTSFKAISDKWLLKGGD